MTKRPWSSVGVEASPEDIRREFDEQVRQGRQTTLANLGLTEILTVGSFLSLADRRLFASVNQFVDVGVARHLLTDALWPVDRVWSPQGQILVPLRAHSGALRRIAGVQHFGQLVGLNGVQEVHFAATFQGNLALLPPQVIHVVLDAAYDPPGPVIVIPPTVQRLVWQCNRRLHLLPASVTHLRFGKQYNQPLDTTIFSPTLTHLTFGHSWDTLDAGPLPWDYDWRRSFRAPASVYNHALPPLPPSLRVLKLSTNYDHPLPPGLEGLTDLVLCGVFQHQLPVGSLPTSLRRLTLVGSYDRALAPGVLPEGLTQLCLDTASSSRLQPGVFPESLTRLALRNYARPLYAGVIPRHVTRLTFGTEYQPNVFAPDIVPTAVTHLTISIRQEALDDCVLPPHLQSLHLGLGGQVLTPGYFPVTLRHLVLDGTAVVGHDVLVPDLPAQVLPVGLTSLRLLSYGATLRPGVLPATLRRLTLAGHRPSTLAVGVVPPQVTHVSFGREFQQPLVAGMLPPSVHFLNFDGLYQPSLRGAFVLPAGLTNLRVDADYQLLPPDLTANVTRHRQAPTADVVAAEAWYAHPNDPVVVPAAGV